ncbi:DUF2793 domain-containing protein, partial [Candidatus Pacearchaeota archaeon]|nr:DUF2793 domain-containing protein [Candidatus Pacearchaeota archaeon]
MTSYQVTPDMHSAWQEPIIALQSSPPASPSEGDRYIVLPTGTGAWSGHDNAIAWYYGAAWTFCSPINGWRVYDEGVGYWRNFNGVAWGGNAESLYALLGGRSGGQTICGGTGANEDLTLDPTSHATKGNLVVKGDIISKGLVWTIRTSAADNQWRSVCYGNGLFVAVAITGSGNRVMTSPDGINWTIRTSAADNGWLSVCYGNGLFVAVANTGSGNRVMTSPDGINWTIRTSAADNGW